MRGRAFIGVLGGAAAWPLAAHTQPNRVRRVGVLMGYAETDPTALAFLAAFKQGLAALGWSEGKNLYIEVRWLRSTNTVHRPRSQEGSIERRAASSNLDLQRYGRNEFAKSERRDGQPPWRDWKPYSFAAYRNLGETPLVGIGTV
jgi:hypothetical protein